MSDQQLIKVFGPDSTSNQRNINTWIDREKPDIISVTTAGGGNKYNAYFMTTILYRERTTQQQG